MNCPSESNSTKLLLIVYLFKKKNISNDTFLNFVLKLKAKQNNSFNTFNSFNQKTTAVHFKERE